MIKMCLATIASILFINALWTCNTTLSESKQTVPLIINVQPFGSMPQNLVQQMVDTLRKHYQHIKVLPAIP